MQEPILNKRFYVDIKELADIDPILISECTLPSFGGRSLSGAQIIFPLSIYFHYNAEVLSKLGAVAEQNKSKAVGFTYHIVFVNGIGEELCRWTIDVQDILEMNFGRLSHEGISPATIKMMVKPSDCRVVWRGLDSNQ